MFLEMLYYFVGDVNAKFLQFNNCCSFGYLIDFINGQFPIIIPEPIVVVIYLVCALFLVSSLNLYVLRERNNRSLRSHAEDSDGLISRTSASLPRAHDVSQFIFRQSS